MLHIFSKIMKSVSGKRVKDNKFKPKGYTKKKINTKHEYVMERL